MENLETNMEESSGYGLRDVFTVIFKHRKKIIGIFLAIVAVVALVTFQLPPEYEAKSSLLVKMGREYMSRPEVGENRQVMSMGQAEVTQSEIQIMTNENLIMKVISKIGLDRMYPGMAKAPSSPVDPVQAAAAIFKTNLTVEAIKNSTVIEVSFKHRDPKIAAQAVNLLVEYFKEKHLQVFSDPASSFTENQLAAYELKLRESENNLQAFKQKSRVFSIDEQKSLLLRQKGDIDAALRTSETVIHELQGKIPSLKARMNAISRNKSYSQPEKDRIIDDTKNKILAMQLEEQQLLKKYTETNPLVVNFRKEMELVRNFLRDQEQDLVGKAKTGNAIYQGIEMDLIRAETELSSQKGRMASLKQQFNQISQEVQQLDHSEKDLQALKREQVINEKNYQTYVTRAEEARISQNMDRLKLVNISVIQQATAPAEPIASKKGKYMLQGVIFGLIAGLGTAFLAEYLRQGLSTPEAVERRIGLPVLATISNSEG